ncbi:hypothetical protein Q2K19_21190 [Micromonospora soli]|uniref:hypothetical protein n=1 Tax=Micromonospora sp. NBRC 110009 TaxID=3061627 RepID=UPI0026715864|nr:hypothetical protein [Micromonospora sp. NBRC 110009]WKT96710.1 hypothetical protein Q2K19_21190 [Micromonospora sp. NBRC 110009]
MSAGQDQTSEAPAASRVLTSAPWMVVLLGVGLLTTLLLVALFSLRAEEHHALPTSADPPIYLPTAEAQTTSAAPSDAPPVGVDGSPSPTPSRSVRPSAQATPDRPSTSPRPATLTAPSAGDLTATYEATGSGRDWFEARLTVTNGSGRSQSWQVELLFAGNVKSVEASSTAGVSVSTQGSGVFVLRGTGALPSGKAAVVKLHFRRTGTGDRPGQCTVNDTDCVIG